MTTYSIAHRNAATLFCGDLSTGINLDDYVGEFYADYDMDAVNADFKEACVAVLETYRPDWIVVGDEVWGEAGTIEYLTEDEAESLRYDVDQIDVEPILDRHARVQA